MEGREALVLFVRPYVQSPLLTAHGRPRSWPMVRCRATLGVLIAEGVGVEAFGAENISLNVLKIHCKQN